jgi:enoyl-CoA hydratase/carnithine racemase
MFAPAEARELGYLDRVLPPALLADAVKEEAQRLRALHMPSYAATKARINQRVLDEIRAAIASELTLPAS